MDMSAQQFTDMLGSLVSRRASTPNSTVSGAAVAVTPVGNGSRFARMIVTLPNGQTFEVRTEEIF